mmetsp:Transcript_9998/g.14585  ORF Transcript_9998/g.14585 Transcript_9998/m.14585 type:complete len:92 (+) Transcript_9998:2711-2986(+)
MLLHAVLICVLLGSQEEAMTDICVTARMVKIIMDLFIHGSLANKVIAIGVKLMIGFNRHMHECKAGKYKYGYVLSKYGYRQSRINLNLHHR